jgi:hypothetical protein
MFYKKNIKEKRAKSAAHCRICACLSVCDSVRACVHAYV